MIGEAGEVEQKRFLEEYDAWIEDEQIISFYFQAFDEQWKGGFDGESLMQKAEKHWCLYLPARKPKAVLR